MESAPPSPQSTDVNTAATPPESLPRLHSIAPAIFIPITEDLTAPLPAAPSATTARLEAAIEKHMSHSRAVQANIINFHRREAYRRSLDPTASESAPPRPLKDELSEHDRANLIRCLEAPHDPAKEWRGFSDQIPWPNRDKLTTQQLHQLGQATSDLEVYRNHSNKKFEELRAEWRQAKDREAA
jgi:hypothetical protein